VLDWEVLPESVPPLERIAGPGHSFRSQLCREHGGSDCGRRRAALPHRKLSDPRYTKWNTGGDRDGDSVRHRLAVQSEDHASPTGRADGCEHSLVPTLQRNLLRKATEHLVGRCDRRDHCPSVCLVTAGHSQHAGNHVTGMARSSGSVGVVTVEIPNKNSIREGRQIYRRILRGTDHASRRISLFPRCHAPTVACCVYLQCTYRAAY